MMKVVFSLVILLVNICLHRVEGELEGEREVALVGGIVVVGMCIVGGIRHHECCATGWIHDKQSKDRAALINELEMKLLGQHLVMKTVPNAIYNHINDNDNDGKPKKPLVMSFHGLTGVGKTYLSQLIAKYIYYKGGKSAFVHTLIASKHFPDDDPTKIKEYKNKLRDLVESETKKCGRSLFIFDETDKMPAGLTDVLKPLLDFHVDGIDGVDYSKNIFIFLNNIGGGEISDVALAQNRSGLPRESISSFKMEQILSVASLKKEHSWLKKNPKTVSLVDHFIPFLPLEKHHVKQCVGIEITRRVKGNKSDSKYKELVENVVNEIEFFPTGEDIFAVSGCKHVAKKVDMFWNNYGGEL